MREAPDESEATRPEIQFRMDGILGRIRPAIRRRFPRRPTLPRNSASSTNSGSRAPRPTRASRRWRCCEWSRRAAPRGRRPAFAARGSTGDLDRPARHGSACLRAPTSIVGWRGNDLDAASLERLIADETSVKNLRDRSRGALEPFLLDELRLSGAYERLAERARKKSDALAALEAGAATAAPGHAPSRCGCGSSSSVFGDPCRMTSRIVRAGSGLRTPQRSTRRCIASVCFWRSIAARRKVLDEHGILGIHSLYC